MAKQTPISALRLTAFLRTGSVLLSAIALVLVPTVAQLQAQVLPPTPDELDSQIADRKAKVDDLQRRADAYQKNLEATAEKRADLEDDLSGLADQMESLQLKLDTTDAQVDLTELQVSRVEADIAAKQTERDATLTHLGGIVRTLHAQEQISPLALTLSAHSVSDFFRDLSAGGEIYDELGQSLEAVRTAQEHLDLDRTVLAGQLAQLSQVRDQQRELRGSLDDQQNYKAALLGRAKQSEDQLSSLLSSVRDEAASINAEISTLEEQARTEAGEGSLGSGHFRWPVEPTHGISAYFHDPTYPFRCTSKNPSNCIGEHNAIDIPQPQGTPVRAADDGYVAIARKLDWVRNANGQILYPAYNYVVLIHANGLSTVYGHLSQVLVNQDTYVKKGDVIARSGATPGTAGAGRWTTGAHLHFEVRINGIPDDPLKYLP